MKALSVGAHPHGILCGCRTLCACPPQQGGRADGVTLMASILVVNAGSSSVKFEVFTIESAADLKAQVKPNVANFTV
jgi:uncharacterized RmlC-like cupin family protein